MTYKPIEGLTISNNAGTDFYTETRRKVYSKGTIGNLEGQFQTWDLYKRILNNDLMISYEKTFAEDYGVKVMLGQQLPAGVGGHQVAGGVLIMCWRKIWL